MAQRVRVVDDDPGILESLVRALRLEGYNVDGVSNGEAALARQGVEPADVIVLDGRLPGIDGLDVCRTVRDRRDPTPVLMLTARDGLQDRIEGLDAGADDYLVKPFALEELFARIRALLRRTNDHGAEWDSDDQYADDSPVVVFEDLAVNRHTWEAHRGQRLLALTRTEFSLLELLLMNAKRAVDRAHIFEHVWGCDFGPASNSLEVYVASLRKKTEAAGESRLVHTVRGVGYIVRCEPGASGSASASASADSA